MLHHEEVSCPNYSSRKTIILVTLYLFDPNEIPVLNLFLFLYKENFIHGGKLNVYKCIFWSERSQSE